jgi:hypothetical protein
MSAAPRPFAWLTAGALASIAIAAACKDPVTPTCPTGNVCVPAEVARAFRQTPEEQLSCPSYIAWGVDGGATQQSLPDLVSMTTRLVPPTSLPPKGEGSIDRDGTRKRREAAGTDICCYTWHAPCPPS